jgi:hypothetical protein
MNGLAAAAELIGGAMDWMDLLGEEQLPELEEEMLGANENGSGDDSDDDAGDDADGVQGAASESESDQFFDAQGGEEGLAGDEDVDGIVVDLAEPPAAAAAAQHEVPEAGSAVAEAAAGVMPAAAAAAGTQQQQQHLLLVGTKVLGDVNVPAGHVSFAFDASSRSLEGAGSRLQLPAGVHTRVYVGVDQPGVRQLIVQVSRAGLMCAIFHAAVTLLQY